MHQIKTFYAKPSENRERYRSGILIEPLPDACQVLIVVMARELKAKGFQCIHFLLTDAMAASEWCEAVGVEGVNGIGGILGIWILDKDPTDCIDIVREVIKKHCEG